MLTDAMLAWLHYVLIFALASCLLSEFVLYRAVLDRPALERLARIDLAYGILAVLIIGSGVLRVLYSPKGTAFYLHNAIFWMKMSLFLILALLSIAPTVHYLRLRSAATESTVVTAASFARIRAYLAAEALVLLAIPLCAALMARGFGSPG